MTTPETNPQTEPETTPEPETTRPAYVDRPLSIEPPAYCECHYEAMGQTVPAVTVATLTVGERTARIALCGHCAKLLLQEMNEQFAAEPEAVLSFADGGKD